jgi:ATP-dependent DNA ligase
MNTYQIIQTIASTRSRNEKEAILEKNKDNEELKTFFELALNPFKNFYQKKLFVQTSTGDNNLYEAMWWLNNTIASRKITGNSAIDKIQELINLISSNDAKVIMHILQKESGCDLGASTINKVWPKLIPTYPCLLATAYDEKLANKLNWKAGVFSQLKSDGGRVNIIIDFDRTVKLFSRSGNELNVFGSFDYLGSFDKLLGHMIDGEMMTVNSMGKFNPRTVSNGVFNKCVRNTLSKLESLTLRVTVWDIVPLQDFYNESSLLSYSFRFNKLSTVMCELGDNKLSIISSKIVHSVQQANEHYQELLAAGEEGSMIKDQDMIWENKRSKKQLKLKSEVTGDFLVTGSSPGVGKLTGNLGSLIIETSDGKVVSSMSGFSLKLRSEIWANITCAEVPYVMVIEGENKTFIAKPDDTDIKIGSIIECEYNQLVKGKDNEIHSLFLPRFKCVRNDKTKANTIKELK